MIRDSKETCSSQTALVRTANHIAMLKFIST